METGSKYSGVEIQEPSHDESMDNIACSVLKNRYPESHITVEYLDSGADSYVYKIEEEGAAPRVIKIYKKSGIDAHFLEKYRHATNNLGLKMAESPLSRRIEINEEVWSFEFQITPITSIGTLDNQAYSISPFTPGNHLDFEEALIIPCPESKNDYTLPQKVSKEITRQLGSVWFPGMNEAAECKKMIDKYCNETMGMKGISILSRNLKPHLKNPNTLVFYITDISHNLHSLHFPINQIDLNPERIEALIEEIKGPESSEETVDAYKRGIMFTIHPEWKLT